MITGSFLCSLTMVLMWITYSCYLDKKASETKKVSDGDGGSRLKRIHTMKKLQVAKKNQHENWMQMAPRRDTYKRNDAMLLAVFACSLFTEKVSNASKLSAANWPYNIWPWQWMTLLWVMMILPQWTIQQIWPIWLCQPNIKLNIFIPTQISNMLKFQCYNIFMPLQSSKQNIKVSRFQCFMQLQISKPDVTFSKLKC